MTGNVNDLNRRVAKLETLKLTTDRRPSRRFVIEGPAGLGAEAAAAFLRKCGHEVRDDERSFIRVVIGAENGKPVDLPLEDLTARYVVQRPDPVSSL